MQTAEWSRMVELFTCPPPIPFLKRRLVQTLRGSFVRLRNDRRSRFGDDFRGETAKRVNGGEERLLIEFSKKAEGWRERGIKWEVNEPVNMGGRFVLSSEFAWTAEREAGNKKGAHRILEQFRLAASRAIRSTLFPLWITDETKEGGTFPP